MRHALIHSTHSRGALGLVLAVISRWYPHRPGLIGLIASGLCLAAPAVEAAELVSFESAVRAPRTTGSQRVGRASERPPQQLYARLSRPAGEGPHPAVVLMHGCAGVVAWNDSWTKRLIDWGYVVLDVDSFGPRGQKDVCDRVFDVSPAERALDAFGAKVYLERRAFVDANRIAVLGMSHGGWAALIAARQDVADNLWAEPFQASVALYPWCEAGHRLASPLLILIGELDDWTPAARCVEQVAGHGGGTEVRLEVYPDAYHGFDFEGLDVVQNGHVIRYDADTAARALDTVRSFLATQLRSAPD